MKEVGSIAKVSEDVFNQCVGDDSITPPRPNTDIIAIDERYFRPTEVDLLIGDSSKARKELNWEPKYDLTALIGDMVLSDLKLFKKEFDLMRKGHKILSQAE